MDILVVVPTSSRRGRRRPFAIPLDDRERKRVVLVPGFIQALVEPVRFRLKTRVICDGFGLHFQNYPSTRL